MMLDAWLQDIESLEAISQDECTRRVFQRMAAMSQDDRTPSLLAAIAYDGELDDLTKMQLSELAQDSLFLHAIDEYTRCTRRLH